MLAYWYTAQPPTKTRAMVSKPMAAEALAETRGKTTANMMPSARMTNSSSAGA